MPHQFDTMSDSYDGIKQLPVGLAEQASLRAALPDLVGASVLDVGAGSGFYPRMFRHLGARRVVGVDASAQMIARARRIEESDPLGISYEVQDAVSLPRLGAFDVVTAVWLLGYAADQATLAHVVSKLTANLAGGGTLVALVPNPDFDWNRLDALPRYGLTIAPTDVVAGRPGSVVRFHTDPPLTIEGRSWGPGAVETALAGAGLTGVRRHPVCRPAGPADGYWDGLLENPTFAVFSAQRGPRLAG